MFQRHQQSDAMFSAERVCSIGREADCKSNVGRAWKGLVPGSHGQDWTLQPCPVSNFRKDVRAFAEKLGQFDLQASESHGHGNSESNSLRYIKVGLWCSQCFKVEHETCSSNTVTDKKQQKNNLQ